MHRVVRASTSSSRATPALAALSACHRKFARRSACRIQAIPTIRPEDIEPFMLRNRVIGAETFDDAPQVVKSVGERVAFSQSERSTLSA